LQFESPDYQRFPCLKLAYEALESGGAMPVALNAANEIAVDAFLKRHISFGKIAEVVAHVLDKVASQGNVSDLQSVLLHDQAARKAAKSLIYS
jgi:1-deoxy-D-xylulose-5-phosphate reductoisomerase